MPLAADIPFQTFGASHWAVLALIVLVSIALPAWARMARSAKVARGICWALAVTLVANELAYCVRGLVTVPVGDFLRNYLPVHICGLAVYLTAWVLLRPNQLVYELAYFWGLGGTLQAILTPSLLEGFPSYWFFQYFITHGGILVGAAFATWGLRMRPARGAVLRVFVITNLYMILVAGVDWVLGANYMFLRAPPAGESPFFFLPWPWYILFLEFLGVGIALLLYLPFAISDRLPRRHR